MKYEHIILDLLDRVSKLEKEVETLKTSGTTAAAPKAHASSAPATVRIGRDTTKYILDGVKYGKSRLVLAIVRKFYEEHPDISAEDFIATFDRSLQGSLGVIRRLDDVRSYSLHERRFFCGDGEKFTIDGVDYVVCTQWSNANINNMIVRAKELGINVTIVSIGGLGI